MKSIYIKQKRFKKDPSDLFGKRLKLSFLWIIALMGSFSLNAQSTFDLALKMYPTDNAPVVPGQIASFTLEVHNQGDIAAQNIKLVDYIPTGLSFVSAVNPDWSSVGSKAITTITSVINPGEFYSITLNLQLRSIATPTNIANFAEISLTQDIDGIDTSNDDIDSTPDTNPNNDNGADPFSSTDDFLLGNGISDEDDHDVALLIICTQNACNDHVNISLNAACDIEILADMIVENPAYPNGAYTIILKDEQGNILPGNMVDGTFVGQTLEVTAFIEGCEADGCWGLATIEDKYALELFCSVDTVDCGESGPEFVGLPLKPGTESYYQGGNLYIIPGNNGCSDTELSYEDETIDLPCQFGSPYVIKINRTWTAIDGQGNENSCTSEIFVRKGYLADLIPPPNYDGLDEEPLLCGEYPVLPDGNPDPTFTGFPGNTSCPNIITVYQDLEVPSSICPGTFDVIREWTVVDWCNSEDTTFQQIIKIMDLEAPFCSPPFEFTGENYPDFCKGKVDVVNPTIIDNCSDVTFTIAYKPYTIFNDNLDDLVTDGISGEPFDYEINWLPVGRYRIVYFISDACGNTSICKSTFRVVDNQVPTPVCIISTSVVLDAFGEASLPAEFFDVGSFDNCAVDRVRVARMNAGCGSQGANNPFAFDTSVDFCCQDAGQEVMVVLRVYDLEGNHNDCMISVYVSDDQIPTIVCPPDMTFTCSEYDAMFQTIPTYISGFPVANDNCFPEVTYFDTKVFNNCNVGIVVRNWSAVDQAGNEALCKQYFEIESDFQFDVSMVNWPSDITLNQCLYDEVDPSISGFPILPSYSCSSFDITYNDFVIQNNGAGCGQLERTFTVVDECAIDPNNNSFSYVQTITIYEDEDPMFDNCENVTFIADNNTCEAFVNHDVTATDNCTAPFNIIYSHTVDVNSDGIIDENNNGNTLSGFYPVGKHRATFSATDECGNEQSCVITFTVKEEKQPTPVCIPISVTLDENGEVEVWANDFNHKSYDNCTAESDLTFSFSEDINDDVHVYDCSDITNGVLEVITVRMYAWDESGNYDYCNTTITITDTEDFCQDAGTLTVDISGKIMKVKTLEDFPNVSMQITGNSMTDEEQTNNAGNYAFSGLSLYDNYTLKPYKNDDALNGITTLDIINIQKHLLGINVLSEMDQLIAADVDANDKITGADIVQLRKLILGKYSDDSFPSNTSWRFIPAAFNWNPIFPFDFPESMEFDNITSSYDEAMFYGIKVGDVNGSATIDDIANEAKTRKTPYTFYVEDQSLIENELVHIPVYGAFAQNVEGMQFAISIDETRLEVHSLSSPIFELSPENYNIVGNTIYVSWTALGGVDVEADDVLFTLDALCLTDDQVQESDIRIATDFQTELFDNKQNVRDIKFDIRSSESEVFKPVQLINCTPNPFSEISIIDFTMKSTGTVKFKVYNSNGVLVHTENQIFSKGESQWEFGGSIAKESGIYILTMESNDWYSSLKLIKI